jgi:eukaryotic-like serine/threonine-protein kinase
MSRYAAFISYARADAAWAEWLLRRLEGYRVPSRLVGTEGRFGRIERRLGRMFRDRDELPSAGDLARTIRAGLAASDVLVVICSPAAVQSRWVGAEVEAFRAEHGDDRILCFAVGGEPGSQDPATQCFPAPLLRTGSDGAPVEPLAADARPQGDGRERAFLKLVAGLLGVGFDELAQREAQRRHRRMALVAVAAVAGMAVTSTLAITAHFAREDATRRQAQAEDLLGFMLGDLRRKLDTVGRLDLMRTVDDKATDYFSALDARDLGDNALAAQARSLTGIGEVRLAEGRHDEAMRSFEQAHARLEALLARAPDDGQRLFDLAQAQYWVGLTFWRQRRFDDAGVWLTRYRDSAIVLAAKDPANFDWQLEVAYGHHNLAVLANSLERYEEAEREFRDARELYRGWLAERQDDMELRWEAADIESWLGTVASQQGRLREAIPFFAAARDVALAHAASAPDDARWREESVNKQLLLANALTSIGDWPAARIEADAALRLSLQLVEQDPENTRWQTNLGSALWRVARLSASVDDARDRALAAEAVLAAVHAVDPKERRNLNFLARARLLLGEVEITAGRPTEAANWLQSAVDVLAPAWEEARDYLRMQMVDAQVMRSLLLVRDDATATAAAQHELQEALALLLEGVDATDAARIPFERLAALDRVFTLLERDGDAVAIRQRLQHSGFVPPPLSLAGGTRVSM